MVPTKTGGFSEGIDRSKNEDQQLETMIPNSKERCGNSQFISFVPNSMAGTVPAMPFQPGFSHVEPSPSHFQCQFSFPCALPVSTMQRSPMPDNYAPSASYTLQEPCIYNGFDQHFNLSSSGIRNPIAPPSIHRDNNFINIRSEYNDSVFMARSSHSKEATVPGLTFSVNFPLSRPDCALEIVQSRYLENSPTLNCCREFGGCEVSKHQIFSQSINQRLIHEERVTVMRKELTKSDVASIGRIVIPKKDAEANFPPLFEREGIVLRMEDVVIPFTWEFKYRFWPNHKSRMYILENAGEFIKTHGLQAGDFLSIHRNPVSATYFVEGEKRTQLPE